MRLCQVHVNARTGEPPNIALEPTAFGAQDRGFFDTMPVQRAPAVGGGSAPTLGGSYSFRTSTIPNKACPTLHDMEQRDAQ